MRSFLPASLIAAVLVFSPAVSAFSFSVGDPTQCDDLKITWTGGQPPFQLLLSPAFGTAVNYSIPASSFNNNQGSYSTQLNLAEGKKFVLTMSDATGIGTGGTSELLTVGASVGGSSCNTSDPGVAFTYQTDSALQQCRQYPFTNYNGATQPVTILGLIPGGNTTVLRPANGGSFSWTVNVAAGTSMLFEMYDSQGRQGGVTDVLTVGSSDDTTCLNQNSPSTTAAISTASNTGAAATSSTATSSSSPSSTATTGNQVSMGAIIGTVLGGILAIAILVTLGLFFLKKWRGDRLPMYGGQRRRSQRLGSVDLTQDHPYNRPYTGEQVTSEFTYPVPHSADPFNSGPLTPVSLPASAQYEPRPFTLPATSPSHVRTSSKTESAASPMTDASFSSSARQKAAMAGVNAYRPTRLIVHNDLEDVGPGEAEEEVVELPPQYTDRRELQRQPSSSEASQQPSSHMGRRSSAHDIPVPPVPSTRPSSPPPPITPSPGTSAWFDR